MPENFDQEAASLRAKLQQYDHEYYVLGRPSVSDQDYDGLLLRLQNLEKTHPELQTSDSPTLRVGSDLSADFAEVRHSIPVLSLDKAYSLPEILTWVKRCSQSLRGPAGTSFSCVIEEKLDGLSLVLYYEKGVLARAVTRGNGEVGNDVTANVRTIRDVPLRLSQPVDGTFRGEVFLSKSDFASLNQQQEIPYANPRNLAGGTLRRVKSAEVAGVPLRLFVYEGFYPSAPASHGELLTDLTKLGFRVNLHYKLVNLPAQVAELEQFILAETKGRPDLPYEIDGLVIKVNQLALREPLGYTGHHPRWAIAFKFESPQGLTRVQAIDVQVGRTGRVTPVARVDPVQVSGSTIQNVTLHNQDYINALELAVGDLVNISRRGDVIPAVEEVVEKGSGHIWLMPLTCPTCQTTLVKNGAHHFCPQFDCPDRRQGRLQFFVARDQMNIEGLGPETLDFLVQQGFIKDLPDMYRLPFERLTGFPGFGEKKVQNLRDGLAKSRLQPFQTVLTSLGLPDLGPKVAELLITAGYASMASLFQLVDTNPPEAIQSIKGIGPKTAESLWRELANPRLRQLVSQLQAAGLSFEQSATTAASAIDSSLPQVFAGQVWCVTGTFEQYKPRSLAMDEILKRGGRESDSVTRETTHLLVGEAAGSKREKAEKLGTIIVTEAEFQKILGV